MSFILSIPIPPSANNLFASVNGHRRIKTRKYKQWLETAGKEIMVQRPKPVTGDYRLYISLPKTNGDPDNRIKAASDLLVSMGLIEDDRRCVSLHVLVAPEIPKGFAVVSVEAVE